jgi:hypothetical protein
VRRLFHELTSMIFFDCPEQADREALRSVFNLCGSSATAISPLDGLQR